MNRTLRGNVSETAPARGRPRYSCAPALVAGLAALLAAAPLADAQGLRRPDPRADARARFGPFYVTPTILVEEVGVDTNVFNSLDDEQSDLTATLKPRLDIAVPIARRALLTARPSLDVVYYHEFSNQRSLNPGITGRGDLFLGRRFTVFGGGGFLKTRQRPSFEVDARATHTRRDAEAGVIVGLLPRVSLELAGRQSTTEFEEDEVFFGVALRDTLNRTSRAVVLTTRYAATPLTTFLLSGEAEEHRFPFAADRDADTVRVEAGVELLTRALISGRATVGVRRFQTLTDAAPDFQGTVAAASLDYTLLGRTHLVFAATRDVAYSFERTQPYYLIESYGLTVRQYLGRRFEAGAGAARHQYSYRDFVAAGAVPPTEPRVDRTWNYTASFAYRFERETAVGVAVSYWDRESSTQGFRAYQGLRVGALFSYGTQP